MSIHETFSPAWQALPGAGDAPAPGLQLLVVLGESHDFMSLSILLDLLAAANRIAGAPCFTCAVTTEDRLTEALHRLEGLSPPERQVLLVADGEGRAAFPPALPPALRRVWGKGGRVGAWGSGCLALAEARLLSGRSFALAMECRSHLAARWPGLRPVERSFCEDTRVLTSVGKSIMSDLVLHLIHQRCGWQVMTAAMDHCLIHRPPGDGHLAADPPRSGPAGPDPRLQAVDRWIDHNIARRIRTGDLAEVAGVSIRQLERLFLRQMNRTPADHVERKRLSHARHLMQETDMGIGEIARATGYLSAIAFRRRFRHRFGVSPG